MTYVEAGHRFSGEHDCFAGNCKRLPDDLRQARDRLMKFEDWGRRWIDARNARAGLGVKVGEVPPWRTIEEARKLNDELDGLING